MKIFRINLNIEQNKTTDDIKIIPIADTHIGDPLLDIKLLERVIKEIEENDNYYTIINGDIVNMALKNSKSNIYDDELTPSQQIDKACQMLSNLARLGKILIYKGGNHEARTYNETGIDVSRTIAQRLGIESRYSDEMWYLFLKLGKCKRGRPIQYTLCGYHGSGNGRKIGGKANRLKDMSSIATADLYIMSHVHEMMITDSVIFIPDEQHQTLIEKEMNYILTNSFLKYGGYGENAGYLPQSRSTTEAILNSKVKKITISKVGRM